MFSCVDGLGNYCIKYPIKISLFCRLLLFFQDNEARTADNSDNDIIVKVYFYMTTVHITCFLARYKKKLLKLEHVLVTADDSDKPGLN